MFRYYFRLGIRSLKRNIALTSLMIGAIAVGIGACMTALTVFRAMSGDPIPEKSSQLYTPQIDNWAPERPPNGSSDNLERLLSYIDVMALRQAHGGTRQAAMFASILSIRPDDPQQKPFKSVVRTTDTDFFAMFAVPFKYGRPWTAAEDENRSAVVVLTREMNE